ncbi:MAG: hypothetical protein PHS74_02215 [Lachnospiraceae bacterium]|nr:hypothetical protein [Lachnospiraceae bacterium]
MDRVQQIQEIREAVNAGNIALQYLNNAKRELSSASNFGIADMLGLDFIGGLGKHMKIDNAKREIELAKNQIRIFQRELRDVSTLEDFNVDIGSFLTFADFFFDGLIADWFVQSKISQAKKQVDTGIGNINAILSQLHRMESELG